MISAASQTIDRENHGRISSFFYLLIGCLHYGIESTGVGRCLSDATILALQGTH
jgi:hypothetical protein